MESKIAEIIEDIFARGYTNEPIDIGVEVDRILALIAADRAGLVEALELAESIVNDSTDARAAKCLAKIDSAMKEMGK